MKKAALNQTYEKDTSQLNTTYNKTADQSQLNSTYTKPAEQSTCESYDITPARHELPPEPLNPQQLGKSMTARCAILNMKYSGLFVHLLYGGKYTRLYPVYDRTPGSAELLSEPNPNRTCK